MRFVICKTLKEEKQGLKKKQNMNCGMQLTSDYSLFTMQNESI